MKKRTKIIIMLTAASAGLLVLGACAGEAPYNKYAEEGYTVSVRYDMNGGEALGQGQKHVSIVDTYKLEDVKRGVKLLAPDDTRRPTATPVNIERSGYFLAGWYTERVPRVDEQDRPLDEDGNLCEIEVESRDADGALLYDDEGNVITELVSENGKPQGYAYDGKWDFSKDVFGGADFDYTYQEGEVALTVYAAWIPNYSYRLMGEVKDEEGNTSWETFATYEFSPVTEDTAENRTVSAPAWDESTGRMNYGKLTYSKTTKKTFVKAYSDPEKQHEVTSFTNSGSWDGETATSVNGIATYYADWMDGLWYHVNNERQFIDNASLEDNLEILADLDFSQTDAEGKLQYEWPTLYLGGSFSGQIDGNGHTIKGVTITQTSSDDRRFGLFGTIMAGAAIGDLTFTGITLNLEQASRQAGSLFGTFAGELQTGAKIEKVSIAGKLVIGAKVYVPSAVWNPDTGSWDPPPHIYDVGLVTGNLLTEGIAANVTLEVAEGADATADGTGRVTIKRSGARG